MYGGISVVPRGIHAMPYHTIQGRIHDIQTCYTPLLPGSIITGTRHQWNNFMSTALKICSLWISTSHLFILRRTVCHRCFCSGAPRFSVFISRGHAKGLGLLWSVALRINCLLSISAPDMSLQLTIPHQTKPDQTKPHESSGSVTAAHQPCARYVHLHLLLLDNTTNSPTELRVIFLIFVIIV